MYNLKPTPLNAKNRPPQLQHNLMCGGIVQCTYPLFEIELVFSSFSQLVMHSPQSLVSPKSSIVAHQWVPLSKSVHLSYDFPLYLKGKTHGIPHTVFVSNFSYCEKPILLWGFSLLREIIKNGIQGMKN